MPCSSSYVDQKKKTIEVALKYWDHGYWPIPKDGKKNYTPQWSTKQIDRLILEDSLRKGWWLGIVLGPQAGGIVCVDIDNKPTKSGLSWMRTNEVFFGNPLIATTPSGGYHLYYRYPGGELGESLRGVTKFTLKGEPGVEVFISGAQVNTWPTIGAKNVPYVLDSGAADLTDLHRYDELPQWIADLVPEVEPFVRIDVGESADPDELDAALEALKRHGPAIQGQGGDFHTFCAAAIGYDYGIPPDLWEQELGAWNESCLPRWKPPELRAKVRSAYKSAQGGLGHKTKRARAISMASQFPDDLPADDAPSNGEHKAVHVPSVSNDPYNFANPTQSARRFLASIQGFITLGEDYFVYRDNSWHQITKGELKQMIFEEILRTTPDANLKESHKKEIIYALEDLTLQKSLTFDSWLDGTTGDFVRLRNGILDLKTRELLPHSPSWFSVTQLNFDYDPDATSPAWDAFLRSCFPGRDDMRAALNCFLGYALSSDMRQHRWLVLWGRQRSGKSTIIRVLTALLGGQRNFFPTELRSLAGDFSLAGAEGKKLIVISDPHDARRDDSGPASTRIKNIVGEDDVMVNAKFKQQRTARLVAKVMMVANRIPSLTDSDGSLSQKFIPIRFAESFLGREDHGLEHRLFAELPGIFNILLEHYGIVQESGRLPVPSDSAEELREIHDQMNPTEAFINE